MLMPPIIGRVVLPLVFAWLAAAAFAGSLGFFLYAYFVTLRASAQRRWTADAGLGGHRQLRAVHRFRSSPQPLCAYRAEALRCAPGLASTRANAFTRGRQRSFRRRLRCWQPLPGVVYWHLRRPWQLARLRRTGCRHSVHILRRALPWTCSISRACGRCSSRNGGARIQRPMFRCRRAVFTESCAIPCTSAGRCSCSARHT